MKGPKVYSPIFRSKSKTIVCREGPVTTLVISEHRTDQAEMPELNVVYDNLFSLAGLAKALPLFETLECHLPVHVCFMERLVYEFGKYVSVGQTIRFVLYDNPYVTWFGLKAMMRKLFGADFVLTSQDIDSAPVRQTFRRVSQSTEWHAAKHTGWTFGILTTGQRLDDLKKFEASVVAAAGGRPYEVLVVTPHEIEGLQGPSTEQLLFDDSAGKPAWITRKKNLICARARYSDILIVHDRFWVEPKFCDQVDRWGYSYSLAVPRVRIASSGQRGLDWAVVSSENQHWSRGALVHYRVYNPFIYCPGGATMLRKAAWEKFPWDENLLWNEHEDVELCRRIQRHGEIIALAPCTLLTSQDRWINENPLLPFDLGRVHLPGPPVRAADITYHAVQLS